jgi:hypothetical protein
MSTPINKLPEVLLTSILTIYITPRDMMVCMTCTRSWRHFIDTPIIWARTWHRYWPTHALLSYVTTAIPITPLTSSMVMELKKMMMMATTTTGTSSITTTMTTTTYDASTSESKRTIASPPEQNNGDDHDNDDITPPPFLLARQLSLATSTVNDYPYSNAVRYRYRTDHNWSHHITTPTR